MYEGFRLQYEQESGSREEAKKRLFQNVDEISKGRKSNIVSLALIRKEDEDFLHETYSEQKESEKKENKLKDGEINSETEMEEISHVNEVSEVEMDERVKEKKEQGVMSEKKSSQDIFSVKTMTSLERKWEKQYGIDHRNGKAFDKERRMHILRE